MVLEDNFLFELFKLFFRRAEIIDLCIIYLRPEYLPSENYKKIWVYIKNFYIDNKKLPTIGIVSQNFASDSEISQILEKIRSTEFPSMELILKQLEQFLKQAKFQVYWYKSGDLYNEGKTDEAYNLFQTAGNELANFSIRNDIIYERIFAGFEVRKERRELDLSLNNGLQNKTPFGIDELDNFIGGGIDITDTFCMLMRSGVGKTKFLRWVGLSTARRGYKVLHIQAEGSKEECELGYDATWTAIPFSELKWSNIDNDTFEKLKKIARERVHEKGEIYVHAFEEFDSASMLDIEHHVCDFEKIHGEPPGLILADYLELFEPGDGKKYRISEERFRRIAIANKMKNIAVKHKSRFGTVTQADNVPFVSWNDPNYFMTRNNISETKGLINPFSYFMTGNQTLDEYDAGMLRIYIDKFRNYRSHQLFTIATAYEYDKFYDKQRTLKEFYKED